MTRSVPEYLLSDSMTINASLEWGSMFSTIRQKNAPELNGIVTRMADWIKNCEDTYSIAVIVLSKLRQSFRHLEESGFSSLQEQLQSFWKTDQRVAIEQRGRFEEYIFKGVDTEGRILLEKQGDIVAAFEPEQIETLREL
jgi:biotin-(acetyl-CoA carboxylase) ligase